MSTSRKLMLLKIVLIGDAGAGKSTLLHQLTEKRFHPQYDLTIGVEFGTRHLQINNETVKLQVWDTAGHPSHRAISRSYYNNVHIAMFVHASHNLELKSLQTWLNEANTCGAAAANKVLVINNFHTKNKAIAAETLERNKAALIEFCKENKITLYEVDVKSGQGVEDAFIQSAQAVIEKINASVDQNLMSEQKTAPNPTLFSSANTKKTAPNKDPRFSFSKYLDYRFRLFAFFTHHIGRMIAVSEELNRCKTDSERVALLDNQIDLFSLEDSSKARKYSSATLDAKWTTRITNKPKNAEELKKSGAYEELLNARKHFPQPAGAPQIVIESNAKVSIRPMAS